MTDVCRSRCRRLLGAATEMTEMRYAHNICLQLLLLFYHDEGAKVEVMLYMLS